MPQCASRFESCSRLILSAAFACSVEGKAHGLLHAAWRATDCHGITTRIAMTLTGSGKSLEFLVLWVFALVQRAAAGEDEQVPAECGDRPWQRASGRSGCSTTRLGSRKPSWAHLGGGHGEAHRPARQELRVLPWRG